MFGGRIGIPELLIILAIVALVFGVGKLTGIGKVLGKSIREFKEEMHSSADSDDQNKDSPDSKNE